MKYIKIRTGYIALVFSNGSYRKTLTEGSYWVSIFDRVKMYSLAKPFTAPIELNILLRDATLAAHLMVVDVKDNEIALRFEDGQFKAVLVPGRYAYWQGVVEYTFVKVDLNKPEITEDIEPSILNRAELSAYVQVIRIPQHYKGLLYFDGQFKQVLETGVYNFWRGNVTVSATSANMQQMQMEINGQEMLSKDKAALRVNFIAQYQITDIQKALQENYDFTKQLYTSIQLAIREYIGTLTLDEILDNKQSISTYVLESVQDQAKNLGVILKDGGLRDIILPGEMKEIMNQVLVAQKKAQANIITRREETASTRSLLNTAKLMEENEMLFKLKEMEYVEKIADKINSISLSGGTQVVDQLRAIFGA